MPKVARKQGTRTPIHTVCVRCTPRAHGCSHGLIGPSSRDAPLHAVATCQNFPERASIQTHTIKSTSVAMTPTMTPSRKITPVSLPVLDPHLSIQRSSATSINWHKPHQCFRDTIALHSQHDPRSRGRVPSSKRGLCAPCEVFLPLFLLSRCCVWQRIYRSHDLVHVPAHAGASRSFTDGVGQRTRSAKSDDSPSGNTGFYRDGGPQPHTLLAHL